MTWDTVRVFKLIRRIQTPHWAGPRRGMTRWQLLGVLERHGARPRLPECQCLDCLFGRALVRELEREAAS